MASHPLLTPEELRQLLRYDPETGQLYWRERPAGMFRTDRRCAMWNAQFAGTMAGKLDERERRRLFIGRRQYFAHRVAFAIHHGRWPLEIDHINGNRLDNSINNLRECTHAQNNRNRRVFSKASTRKGIFRTKSGKWGAQIMSDGKRQHLGYFGDEVSAARAYDAAARRLHGEFASLNFPGEAAVSRVERLRRAPGLTLA